MITGPPPKIYEIRDILPVLSGCLLGVLGASALLAGGGESTGVVVGAGLASGLAGAALALAERAPRRR